MKNYVVKAENEAEQAEIMERIKHFGLDENLVIKHKLIVPHTMCPTDANCVVKNGDHIINTKTKGLRKGLLVLIDEKEPSIIANNCFNCYVDSSGEFICVGYGDMMVMVCFKGHIYNTAFNDDAMRGDSV